MGTFSFEVLQVVGFKNSGKTTLASKIIRELTKSGYKVGSLKHHGHGGPPHIEDEGTDSFQHREAGAVVSGVEGAGVFQWQVQQERWKVDQLLSLYEPLGLDIIIVEGYKMAHYPKIVLLREQEDVELLTSCSHIQGVISWKKSIKGKQEFVSFHIDQEEQYLPWIMNTVKRRLQ